MNLRTRLSSLILVAALVPAAAMAQYPNRPIRLIVPFGAGGVTDNAARITAQAIEKSLGQPIVVENRPGADGAIAAMSVKSAPADGYTLFFATSSVLSTPLVSKAANFDPLTDFVPISTVGRFPYAMFVHSDVPAASVRDFISYARANPGKVNYGTVNAGEQLAAAQFVKASGVEMLHVPYKTVPVTDLITGRIQVYFGPVGNGLAHVKDGRLRMLAMLVSERSPLAPDVPTMVEAGVNGISVFSYQMFVAPAKTPPEIVERLSKEINAALRTPEVRAQLERVSLAVEGMTPPQLARSLEDANRAWAQFYREAGIERQ
jgi:tripartite-type tricarboxylate transporter receptor subunit TctC